MIEGRRIADRAFDALQAATERQIVVANDPRAQTWFPGVSVRPDDEKGLGPLAGLRTALRAASGDAVLVVAWDMPFVTSALLQAMRRIGEEGATAVVPMSEDGAFPEPLCAYYAPVALETCEQLLARGERRAASLFEALPGAIAVRGAELEALGDPARLLLSVDSPEALAALGGRLPEREDGARR